MVEALYAAGRNDPRTFGSVIRAIAEQLSNTDLTRAEKVFLLRAWRLLVDNNDAFARLLWVRIFSRYRSGSIAELSGPET
jgi:hypothetical protein